MTVNNGRRIVIVTHHRNLTDAPFKTRIFFDRRPADPGPEFRQDGDYPADAGLSKVETWALSDYGRSPRCRQFTPRLDFANDTTRWTYGRGCFADPNRIRVAVAVRGSSGRWDWAPGYHRWGPYVS